jgi:hypothetical protein
MVVPKRNRTLILSLPAELLNAIFSLLDPVNSTCLGLTSKYLYPIHRSFQGTVSLDKWDPPAPAPPLARLIETWIGGGRPYDGGLEFVYSTFSNKFMYLEDIEATHRREMDRLLAMEKSRKAEKRHIEKLLKALAKRVIPSGVRRLQQRYVTVRIRKDEIEPCRRVLRRHLQEARIAVRKKAMVRIYQGGLSWLRVLINECLLEIWSFAQEWDL